MLFFLFVIFGLFSLASQIFILKEISFLFLSHEISLVAGLSYWIFWTGIGAVLPLKIKSLAGIVSKDSFRYLILAVTSVLLPQFIIPIRYSSFFIQTGTIPGFFEMLTLTGILTLIPALFNGLSIYILMNKGAINFYILETSGAVIAGFLTTAYFKFYPEFSILKTQIFVGVVFLTILFLCEKPKTALKSVFFFICLIPLYFAIKLDAPSIIYPHEEKHFHSMIQTPYSRILVLEKNSQKTFIENGFVSGQYPDDEGEEEPTHILLLSHKRPKKILVSGPEGIFIAGQIAKHKPERIDILEIDREKVFKISEIIKISTAPYNIIGLDLREFIRSQINKKEPVKYDIVMQTIPEPVNGQTNKFFTKEFFREIKSIMAEDGILSFQIPYSQTYLSSQQLFFSACILNTLKEEFKNISFSLGKYLTVMASISEIKISPQVIAGRYEKRKIKNKIVVPQLFPFYLNENRIRWFNDNLAKAKNPGINTDFHPLSYFYIWKIWLSMFVSPKSFLAAASLLIFIIIMAVKIIKSSRIWIKSPMNCGIFALGFWAMAFEVIILYLFQIHTGQLYWKMGILFSLFMIGIAIGGLIFRRINSNNSFYPISILALAIIISITGYFAGEKITGLGTDMSLIIFAAGLCICGGLVGGFFAIALKFSQTESQKIYASDLYGSFIGGLLTSSVLVPITGIKISLLLTLIPCLAIIILFIFKSNKT